MKVLVNGGLNLSVLDGWWAEGYQEGVGWAIGAGEEFADADYQDRMDSQALYSLLEQEVVPMFYDRAVNGHPAKWLEMMKRSMRTLVPQFSTARMVKEYLTRFYFPAAAHYERLAADGCARAREVAVWKERVLHAWRDVAVVSVTHPVDMEFIVGTQLPLEARVRLGTLTPADVRVEAYLRVHRRRRRHRRGREYPAAVGGRRRGSADLPGACALSHLGHARLRRARAPTARGRAHPE